MNRIARMPFSSVYPLYVQKAERKGRTQAEVDTIIAWLTGYEAAALRRHLDAGTTFEDFFAAADLHENAPLITGVVCGIRVEEIDDPFLRSVRYLDKLIDELARGKAMNKILRT